MAIPTAFWPLVHILQVTRPFLFFFFTPRRTYSEDEAFCLQTVNTLKGHVTNLHKNQPSPTLVITCAILNVVFQLYSCFHCKSLPRSKIHPFFLGDSIFFIIWQCVTRNYSSQIFIRAICGQSSRSNENTPSHTEIWGHCALYKGYFFLTLGDFSGGSDCWSHFKTPEKKIMSISCLV